MTTNRITPTPAITATCQFKEGCEASNPTAIHHFQGLDLCAYHSPFDADPEAAARYLTDFDARNEGRELIQIATPEEPTAAPTLAPSPYADWFQALLDRNEVCPDITAFERKAHAGYIAYELSMTDGHYAPLDFDAWVIGFRKDPLNDLYRGNDNRHTLAPQANAYIASLSATPCAGGCGTTFTNPDPQVPPMCMGCAQEAMKARQARDGRKGRNQYRGDTLYPRSRR